MNNIKNRILESINNYPSKVAIETPEKTLTYSELNNYIAAYTKKINEICKDAIINKYVLIYVSSPLEEIMIQLAVLMNGGICVPLDRQTPLNYYSLEHIENIACIITDDYELEKQCRYPVLHPIKEENTSLFVDPQGVHTLSNISSENAYCIMTSGSTGAPKAVLLKQESIINQADAKIKLMHMDYTSKICLSMNLSFVASIWQVLATLFVGGTLLILDEQSRRNPYDIFRKADAYQASIICVVPSVLRAFLNLNKESRKIQLKNLSTIVLTGALLDSKLVEKFYQEYDIPLINAYGQTECSDDTFHFFIPKDFEYIKNPVIPIGYPIDGIEFMIIDEFENEVEIGQKGELCIAGRCLCAGYIQDEDYTKQVFKPLKGLGGTIACFTGDIVSQVDNGMLICHGRKDNQVKINGYRIEPEKIELCCMSFPGIEDAVVLKIADATNEYLQLHYTSEKGKEIKYSELRQYLSEKLPSYMVPAVIRKVHTIQYNSNGKKIRNVFEMAQTKGDKTVRKNTVLTKEALHQLIQRQLKKPLDISTNESFYTLLSSLEFVSLVVELEQILDIEFAPNKIIITAFPTLNDFLEYILEEYTK